MRLLWVENHAVFARVAGGQFLAGHEVVVVPTVAAAREALAARPFDAILLDHDLDDGKGTALVAVIRRSPGRLPVVAVSSHDAGNEALLRAGADAACPKMRFANSAAVLDSVVGVRPDSRPEN